MREKSLLYFALGVTTVLSLGAVTNQVSSAPAKGLSLALSDTGITFPDGTVQTTAASADPRRAFYMTISQHNGAQALAACAPGFHMASIWEILDPSNLRYATDAEGADDVFRYPDSGVGPPSLSAGWVRTGFASSASATEGLGNCSAWTSSAGSDGGTNVRLEPDWASPTGTGDPSQIVTPWNSFIASCDDFDNVWCVQD